MITKAKMNSMQMGSSAELKGIDFKDTYLYRNQETAKATGWFAKFDNWFWYNE